MYRIQITKQTDKSHLHEDVLHTDKNIKKSQVNLDLI